MPNGLDHLKHIVVLMMENRSFDHMLGFMKKQVPGIEGLNGDESNPDTAAPPQDVVVEPTAAAQTELNPDPDHSWTGTNVQIFGNEAGVDDGSPKMKGFVKSYFNKLRDVNHSHNIMHCFSPDNLPVLTTLAQQYAVCDRWFSSLPGPTVPNRLFAHFGTSFGNVDNSVKIGDNGKSIYSRLMNAGRSTKIYYFDEKSASVGFTFLLTNQPETMGTYEDFKSACANGLLPDYCFVEPNYSDHDNKLASDQHPDHNIIAGENFIGDVYNHVRQGPDWEKTLLVIVYDEHGGTFDHVLPPNIPPDGTPDPINGFQFDRLGIRVPAVFISPWIQQGTIIHTQYEHASIPATVATFFIKDDPAQRDLTVREKRAALFTADPALFTLTTPRQDSFYFMIEKVSTATATPLTIAAEAETRATKISVPAPPPGAYKPARDMGILLRDHIRELSRLEQQLPPSQRTNVDVSTLVTEAEASDYSGKVVPRLRMRKLNARRCIEDLKATTSGADGARAFEKACEQAVKYLFTDDLSGLKTQSRVEDGFHVMDLIGRLSPRETSGFWGELAQDFRCRYIVFEFKNYTNPISQNQIYTTEKYLYPNALRPAAIVIARNGADEGAQRAIRGALRDAGRILLVLSLNELIEILLATKGGHKASDVMAWHLDKLLMNLAP